MVFANWVYWVVYEVEIPTKAWMLFTSEIQSIIRRELFVQERLHKLAQQETLFSFQSCVCVCLCTCLYKLLQQRRIKPEAWTRTMASDWSEAVDAFNGTWWHTRMNRYHASYFMSSLLFIRVSVKELWLRLPPMPLPQQNQGIACFG